MPRGFGLGEAPGPPNIFVSSTYFDLRRVREELEQHLASLGYCPVLFERAGAIPNVPAPLSALQHASQADICVLIVGATYGSTDQTSDLSWTHREYRTARDLGNPVFAFVEREALVKYELFRVRRDPTFWSEDEKLLFSLLEEVSEAGTRFPFDSLPELKKSLQQQLASYFGYLVRKYSSFDAIAPTTSGGWNTLGVAEARRGDFGKALYCCRRALDLDPARSDARGNLVANLRRLGRLEEAERETRRSIELHPDQPRFRQLLCSCLRAQAKLDNALAEAQQLTTLFPADDRAWATLASSYRLLQRFPEALESQRKAVALLPTGVQYVRTLKEIEAVVSLERAAEITASEAIFEQLRLETSDEHDSNQDGS